MHKAFDVIKTAGRYTVIHDHRKEQIKDFWPETHHGIPISFPPCGRCGSGYPLYRLVGPFVKAEPASIGIRTEMGGKVR